jgi:hypothetical protein
VHHPEQPPLPRIVDDGARRELPARRHRHVVRRADLRVDVVSLLFEVDEVVDGCVVRHAVDGLEIGGVGAESRASKEVI